MVSGLGVASLKSVTGGWMSVSIGVADAKNASLQGGKPCVGFRG